MNLRNSAIAFAVLAAAGCAVNEGAESAGLAPPLATEVSGGDPGSSALKCVNVSGRWQLCGDASRTKLVAGVGIRFFKPAPDGTLVAASDTHPSCDAALADATVPTTVRYSAAPLCGQVFAKTVAALAGPLPTLVDDRGSPLHYALLPSGERAAVDQAVGDLLARDPGVQAIGCSIGPDISISCWGGGSMCAAWIDEDGPGAECWDCEVADCD